MKDWFQKAKELEMIWGNDASVLETLKTGLEHIPHSLTGGIFGHRSRW